MAKKMARKLDMSFLTKMPWDEYFSPVKDANFVKKETGIDIFSRDNYLRDRNTICTQLWNSPQINWDGKLLGCCYNLWGDFGNAFESGLENSLNNEKIEYARKMLLGVKIKRADIPCSRCKLYEEMKKNGNWLTMHEIAMRRWREKIWAVFSKHASTCIVNKTVTFLSSKGI